MFTWNTYDVERSRRDDQIAHAKRVRIIRTVTKYCESPLTRMSIRLLDVLGSKLVEIGSRIQCRCAELTLTNSNRAI